MNVESVQVATTNSKMKNSKTDGQKEMFLEIYTQSISGNEQDSYKSDDTKINMSEKSNSDKKIEGEETCELDEEPRAEAVNVLGLVNMDIHTNKHISGITWGKSIQDESQLSIVDISEDLHTNIDINPIPIEEASLLVDEAEPKNMIGEVVLSTSDKVNSKDLVLSQKSVQEINYAISKLVNTTPSNESNVTQVQLSPEELGTADVILKSEDGNWMTKILVDNEQVKELVTNKININKESIEIKASSVVPEVNTVTTTSEKILSVNDQVNLETALSISKSLEGIPPGENLADSTDGIKVQDEVLPTIEKQDVNFNVRDFEALKVNTVVSAKESVRPDENLQKVNDTIIKLMETTKQGNVSEMKVKLYPEELGSVDVTLRMENGKMIAKILVDNEQVKQLFANKINELSNNLEKQNISIDKIQIDVNSNTNFGSRPNQNKASYMKRNSGSLIDIESEENLTVDDTAHRSGAISILA